MLTWLHWFYMHDVRFAEQQDQVPPAPPREPETACATLLRQSTSHYILRLLFVSDGWLLCWTWGINLPTVMCFWLIHEFVDAWRQCMFKMALENVEVDFSAKLTSCVKWMNDTVEKCSKEHSLTGHRCFLQPLDQDVPSFHSGTPPPRMHSPNHKQQMWV